MRLLFIAPVIGTHGEVSAGLGLAGQLAEAGIRSHFVVDTHNVALAAAAGHTVTEIHTAMGADIVSVVERTAKELRPDAIVLSDYLSYWLMMTRVYRVDPWFVERLGVPVLPMDLYEWAGTDFRIDHFGARLEVERRILDMPVWLRPVPWARPDADATAPSFPYRAAQPAARPPAAERRETRRALGVRDTDRLLVLPVSDWQRHAQTSADPGTRQRALRVPELLSDAVRRLPDNTHILLVGPHLAGFDGLPAERTHALPACAPQEFQRLLESSDAFLSLHIPASGLIRAVHADLPTVYVTHGAAGSPEAEELEPYHLWPLQWNSVMAPLLAGNPVSDALCRVELLPADDLARDIDAVLNDPVERERLAEGRARYLDACAALPPTAEVFAAAANHLSLSAG
ncbi:DUF6365 family protein [Streptomyces sp. NPDC059639]|uniref:DUF6365 family protein n=1 Tax=Streptomyces sp. NPDC059639 TaxID=3346891 RepID=UPI0036B07B63